ncbi:MAG: hypothetical protein JXM73_08270 [Anaerolineae bacterium]|nr:hypothetical protein [Anaerolineae bacterium]
MKAVDYLIATGGDLPPIRAGLYEYVLAGNGLFVRGQRCGLAATIPVAPCRVRGLAEVSPRVDLSYPKIPRRMLGDMLYLSWCAAVRDRPVEMLFHLWWDGGWRLIVPDQAQTGISVVPTGPAIGSSYEKALVEVHSHHVMKPVFSAADDRDEVGFRIYAVLGNMRDRRPGIRVRVGLYGYAHEIPARLIFEMPDGLMDCVM